jgi:hypothetical protein
MHVRHKQLLLGERSSKHLVFDTDIRLSGSKTGKM